MVKVNVFMLLTSPFNHTLCCSGSQRHLYVIVEHRIWHKISHELIKSIKKKNPNLNFLNL